MEPADKNALLTRIHSLLYSLGVSGNICGFPYVSCALYLSMRRPGGSVEALYPEIARLCGVQPEEVRRDFRRVLFLIWKRKPEYLRRLMGEPCRNPPTPKAFLNAACRCLGK